MAGIFGSLTTNDTNRGFLATQGQIVVWDMVQQWLARVNEDMASSLAMFVEEETPGFKERYPLPGGGFLQRKNNQGSYAAVKASGKIDVAFPLTDQGAQLAWDDVAVAKMTARQLENHLDTIRIQNQNSVRFDMLQVIFDNVQATHTDEDFGSLSIEPLANGDSVKYPPVIGARTDATEDHYLESGYTGANISDENNPLITLRKEIDHHFGRTTGGQNIVVFNHSDNSDQLASLTDFREVIDNFIDEGDNVDVPSRLPVTPGIVSGRSNGVWVIEWDEIPTGYLLAIHADLAAPLKQRVDEPDVAVSLGSGLSLVSTHEHFPFTGSFWRHRYGFGAANRLNGAVMELATGGSYTVPAIYDRS